MPSVNANRKPDAKCIQVTKSSGKARRSVEAVAVAHQLYKDQVEKKRVAGPPEHERESDWRKSEVENICGHCLAS